MRKRPTKREQLAKKIAEHVASQFGMDLQDFRLYPNKGRWRWDKFRYDVMPWHGFAKWHSEKFSNPLTVTVGSWSTMTDLLRHGFTVDRNGATDFELDCKYPVSPNSQ